MKTTIALMLMVCCIASVGVVSVSEADILSELMANPPQAPYADRKEPVAGPSHKPIMREHRGAYQNSTLQSRTVLITPEGTQSTRRPVTDQGLRASELRQQAQLSMRPMARVAAAPSLESATAPRTTNRARVAKRQRSVVRAQAAYQQNQPRRTQPLLASAHTQQAQTAYAPHYAQQPAYAGANYYQGYAYQGWNTTNAAACGPGRA